jgi:hypothetical protein
MVQIKLSVIFLLAAAAIAPIVALPLPNPVDSNKRGLPSDDHHDGTNPPAKKQKM